MAEKRKTVSKTTCNTSQGELEKCYSALLEKLRGDGDGTAMTEFQKQFLEFTERSLGSDVLDADPQAPDLHHILASLAEGEDVWDLMTNIPEDRIGEVLTWVMNVDVPESDTL